VPITLSTRGLRRTAAAGVTVTLSFALMACGANFNAQTSQPYQPAEGTNADSGSIAVRNLLALASEDGKGELHGVIVNKGTADDTLVKIEPAPAAPAADGTVPAEEPVTVTFGNVRPMTLAAGGTLTLPPPTGQPFTVTGGKPGDMIKLTITFAKAAPITTSIPVLTLDHYSPTPRDDAEPHG
jgi:copper(I)-binding protein